jgi:hypothetical protein
MYFDTTIAPGGWGEKQANLGDWQQEVQSQLALKMSLGSRFIISICNQSALPRRADLVLFLASRTHGALLISWCAALE